jgi:hypothetical protein
MGVNQIGEHVAGESVFFVGPQARLFKRMDASRMYDDLRELAKERNAILYAAGPFLRSEYTAVAVAL